jgi:transcriptional regulator with XRE-family HTH domain
MTQTYRGLGLKPLPPETWGRRLARARILAGYNLRQVESILATQISHATLNRLEHRETVPIRRQDRARAFLVLVLYRVDPADFGLGPDDMPPATDVRALARLRTGGSGWMRVTAGRLVLAA